MGRSSHYRWREKDSEYRAAFDQAKEDATDVLETEAFRRAVEGVRRTNRLVHGRPGETVRKYSDVLLIFLLKDLRSERCEPPRVFRRARYVSAASSAGAC